MDPTEGSSWQCRLCTLSNSSENKECEACGSPSFADGTEWQCTHCTMFTPKDIPFCKTCNRPRPGKGASVAVESENTKPQTLDGSPRGMGLTVATEWQNTTLQTYTKSPHGAGPRSAHGVGRQTNHGLSPVRVAVQETAGCESDQQGLGPTFSLDSQYSSQPYDEVSGGDGEVLVHCGGEGHTLGDMATDLTPDQRWLCDGCSTPNSPDVYKCSSCKVIKPYFPSQAPKQQTTDMQQPVPFSSPSDGSSADGSPLKKTASLRHNRVFASNPLEVADDLNQFYFDPEPSWGDIHTPIQEEVHNTSVETVIDFPDSECRIVFVGKTGHGKSTTANTILGVSRFEASLHFHSTTKKCQRHSTTRFGIHLEVMDTPGLFDTELSEEDTMTEIARCLGIIAPGPHAVVLVIRIDVRFTEEEEKAVEKVHSVFGVQLLRHLVIVFTHGDSLLSDDDAEKSRLMKDMLDRSPRALKKLLKEANDRYVVFNNKADASVKEGQVRKLILTIKELLAVNGGRPYTSPLLEKVEESVRRREKEVYDEHYGRKGQRGMKQNPYYKRHARDMVRDELAALQDNKTALLKKILKEIMPIIKPVLTTFLQIMLKKANASGHCSIL